MKRRHSPDNKIILIDESSNWESYFFSIDHFCSMLSTSISDSYKTEPYRGNYDINNIVLYKITRPYKCLSSKWKFSCHIPENRHKLRYDIDHHDRYSKN